MVLLAEGVRISGWSRCGMELLSIDVPMTFALVRRLSYHFAKSWSGVVSGDLESQEDFGQIATGLNHLFFSPEQGLQVHILHDEFWEEKVSPVELYTVLFSRRWQQAA